MTANAEKARRPLRLLRFVTVAAIATLILGNSASLTTVTTASAAETTAAAPTPPGAPMNLVAKVSGDRLVAVSWTAPPDGGSPISYYTVTSLPDGTVVYPTSTTITADWLVAGASYRFVVSASNVAGTGPDSVPSNAVSACTLSDPPTGLALTPGNTSATVGWTAPAYTGGCVINTYAIATTPATTTSTVRGSATSATIAGLLNGVSYQVQVTAITDAGPGQPSAPSEVTPRAVPGPPTNVMATAGNASATITWSASASNGSTITGYTVTSTPSGATTTVNGTASTATATGLANGTAYTFSVTATNGVGSGPPSAPSNSIVPGSSSVPGSPTGVTATPGNAAATVNWTPPTSTGYGAITNYTVTSSPGGITATASASATSATVVGLTNGTAYTFSVTAANPAGTGPPSAPSNSVIPQAGVPGIPTNVSAAPANTRANVSWTPPANSGGSAITLYTVTSTPGNVTATAGGSASTAVVTGLTNGVSYTFTVTASNASGAGIPSSPSNAVVPASVPGAPTIGSAVAGNAFATVTWSPPTSDGGNAITMYSVAASPGNTVTTAPGTATRATVSGLTNGTAYTFSVTATNGIGTGAPSASSNPVTPNVSSLPAFDHIFVIVMENRAYENIVGSSSAPYINGLIGKYGLAANYHGVTHDSFPNYMALTGADTFGLTAACGTCVFTAPNIAADRIETSGRSWKAYLESMPAACYGLSDAYPYVERHNPLLHYTDILNVSARCARVVPFTNLSNDLASAATTPNYVWITPNMCHDMHDCDIIEGDTWLSQNVPTILNSPAFTQNSLVIVTWDEDDDLHGNHVATVLIGPSVRPGFRSNVAYNHYSLLKTIEQAWGLTPLTANDGNATAMSDFFP